ncbi:MAG: FecR domain-containing protein [Deltaproteobacteria bacterium]|nr:FecR domain-containing protein [Deltaproteobacteria bacterium]
MKRALVLVGACFVVLGLAWLSYRKFLMPAPAVPAPAPAAVVSAAKVPTVPTPAPVKEPLPISFEMTEVAGQVEIKRTDTWTAATKGDRLGTDQSIRTGPDGRAILRAETGDELALRERVELEVDKLEKTVTELTLTRGKVRAAAAPGTERLQISSQGAQAVGAGGGRFTVYTDQKGAVTVASETGAVKVLAQGNTVTVPERTQAHVPLGGKPSDPVPIPDDVFLRVAWPTDEVVSVKANLRGKATPGTQVLVNGQLALVKDDGTFEAQIVLREGDNRVAVLAEGIDGKTRELKGQILVNTKGPPLDADATRMFDPMGSEGDDKRPRKKRNP